MTTVKVTGLKELQQKLDAYPGVFRRALKTTMEAVLLYVWERIPAYPPASPNSSYRRTGTLGRSLGSSESGGRFGRPDIYDNKAIGAGGRVGRIGTRLEYAPKVIGDEQEYPHIGRWWKLGGVAQGTEPEVIKRFEAMAAELARWLNDQGRPPG